MEETWDSGKWDFPGSVEHADNGIAEICELDVLFLM